METRELWKEILWSFNIKKRVENSRNLMTIRIAQYLGMDKVSEKLIERV